MLAAAGYTYPIALLPGRDVAQWNKDKHDDERVNSVADDSVGVQWCPWVFLYPGVWDVQVMNKIAEIAPLLSDRSTSRTDLTLFTDFQLQQPLTPHQPTIPRLRVIHDLHSVVDDPLGSRGHMMSLQQPT